MNKLNVKTCITITAEELEKALEKNFHESFNGIASLIQPEYSNYSYISLHFGENGVVYQESAEWAFSKDEKDRIEKLNRVRKFLFDQFGDSFDEILVDVFW